MSRYNVICTFVGNLASTCISTLKSEIILDSPGKFVSLESLKTPYKKVGVSQVLFAISIFVLKYYVIDVEVDVK